MQPYYPPPQHQPPPQPPRPPLGGGGGWDLHPLLTVLLLCSLGGVALFTVLDVSYKFDANAPLEDLARTLGHMRTVSVMAMIGATTAALCLMAAKKWPLAAIALLAPTLVLGGVYYKRSSLFAERRAEADRKEKEQADYDAAVEAVQRKVLGLCGGDASGGVDDARGYRAKDDTHPTAVIWRERTAAEFDVRKFAQNHPTKLGDTQAVACVDERITVLETCRYGENGVGLTAIERSRGVTTVRIVDAKTGKLLFEQKLRAEEPPACPGSVDLDDPESATSYVPVKDVLEIIEQFQAGLLGPGVATTKP